MNSKYIKLFIAFSIFSFVLLGILGSHNGSEANTNSIVLSATFPEYTEEELVNKADIIALGKIANHVSDYTMYEDIPFSDYLFEITKFIKVPEHLSKEKELIITQDGNAQFIFDNHPLLKKSKTYLLFLNYSEDGKLIMVGGPNGKFNIENGKAVQQAKLLKEKSLNETIESIEKKIK